MQSRMQPMIGSDCDISVYGIIGKFCRYGFHVCVETSEIWTSLRVLNAFECRDRFAEITIDPASR